MLGPGVFVERLEQRTLLNSAFPVGLEFRVNTYTTGIQRYDPAIALDVDGDFVVAWFGSGQGDASGVFAQRYNEMGVPQGSEFRVNTYTTSSQVAPSIATDADGDFVVAWESYGQDGSNWGVFTQRYDAAGVPQGGECRVNTYTTSGQNAPSVAMGADGDFVVAWQSYMRDGSNWGVFAQRYDAAGAPRGGEFRVNTYTTGSQRSPSLALDADGDFVVAWESFGQNGSGLGVYAQRYHAAGVPQGGEFRVNTYTTSDQNAPSVAMDGDGDFVVAWSSGSIQGYNGFYGTNYYAQRYNAAGVAQGGEFLVNASAFGASYDPSVAMDADGDFVVAWDSGYIPLNPDGVNVHAQRYNAAGLPDGGEFLVNTYTTSFQSAPAVGMDAGGDFVVAWQSWNQEGFGLGIYAQRYAVVPEVTSSSFLFESSPHRLRFRFDHDVRASLGSDDLVVRNLTTGQTVPSNEFAVLYDPTSDVATFIYLGPGEAPIAGIFPDGNYRATMLSAGIETPQGATLAADHEFDFFFLNGDANRDGRVNVNDFTILASNFGHSGTDFTHGDFTYDGTTNLEDFNILAGRFGNELPPETLTSLQSPEAPFGEESIDPDDSFVMDSDYIVVWASGGGHLCAAQRYDAAGVPQGSPFRIAVPTEGRFYTQDYMSFVLAGAGNREQVTRRIRNNMLAPLSADTAPPAPALALGPDRTHAPFATTNSAQSPADDELVPVWELVQN